MIIVSGRLYIQQGQREAFVSQSFDAVKAARQTAGCQDFVVAADSVDRDRVNVYEEWESAAALLAFRGHGPGDDLAKLITRAEVQEYEAVPRAV